TKNNNNTSNSINLIGQGTSITGDIKSDGDIRIDGSIKGNIISKGKVVVGATGNIKGKINCKNTDISGKIEGKIIVSELLSLKSTANIIGDIITNKLAIEPGTKFSGTCNMNESSLINAEKTERKQEEQQDKPEEKVQEFQKPIK
ncbi:unnamed protein product, partial [marine sediment metagenome]